LAKEFQVRRTCFVFIVHIYIYACSALYSDPGRPGNEMFPCDRILVPRGT
jgi:hypothetical protein